MIFACFPNYSGQVVRFAVAVFLFLFCSCSCFFVSVRAVILLFHAGGGQVLGVWFFMVLPPPKSPEKQMGRGGQAFGLLIFLLFLA